MSRILTIVIILAVIIAVAGMALGIFVSKRRKAKNYERGLKMMPMLIHLPPSTDDIQGGGRDERDVTNEALSQAQVMYSIIASTLTKGFKTRVYGQRHISFEVVATNGLIRYYAVVPAVITETVKQAILSAYPTARLEEIEPESIFAEGVTSAQVAGGEMRLKKESVYPIATYEDSKRDASLAILNAMSAVKQNEGVAVQILFRPADEKWTEKSKQCIQNIRDGKEKKSGSIKVLYALSNFIKDLIQAFRADPNEHKNDEHKPLTSLQEEEVEAIGNKTKSPGFETLVRLVASARERERSEAILGGVVAAFAQFDSPKYNGLKFEVMKDTKKLGIDYVFRFFPQGTKDNILNSVELATLFHLPAQNAIPTSQVERQAIKQVDGPARLVTEGVLLGVNEFRGVQKEIRLSENDRRRHTYVIGSTGMGKSVLLTNVAYQDMVEGRGFAFIDPHGDAVELLLSKVPENRVDDVIYFDPADIEHPLGMNMFEFTSDDQKDFIVQEGINMLVSLFDPGGQGYFGPRGQHMFRNAALLLMSDPNGATFIDIPQCFTDPEFVKSKLPYVTDKAVYDYWTKEFPASQKSNDAGEVVTWFASKWGPFLSNTIMRNILGQAKSGFNIREIMDGQKIFLVNLSKGRLGDINSNLLGMILVMKFQAAAMSRADIPEHERKDFCLFVDEFQNFATESFESILSEARKYRLNLFLANQFMTQLTDKIREGILGNVGTIMSGRLGVTDAELMEKAFTPVFNAEDLHKQGNFQAIATVMMNNLPTAPFTMRLLPPMGESDAELMARMKEFVAAKYGCTRAEVEAEIKARWKNVKKEEKRVEKTGDQGPVGELEAIQGQKVTTVRAEIEQEEKAALKTGFLDSWRAKRAKMASEKPPEAREGGSGSEVRSDSAKTSEGVGAAPGGPEPPAKTSLEPVLGQKPGMTAEKAQAGLSGDSEASGGHSEGVNRPKTSETPKVVQTPSDSEAPDASAESKTQNNDEMVFQIRKK